MSRRGVVVVTITTGVISTHARMLEGVECARYAVGMQFERTPLVFGRSEKHCDQSKKKRSILAWSTFLFNLGAYKSIGGE